jgi:hypothetical protein
VNEYRNGENYKPVAFFFVNVGKDTEIGSVGGEVLRALAFAFAFFVVNDDRGANSCGIFSELFIPADPKQSV